MAELSVEQVLLLENLMYISDDSPLRSLENSQGKSVGDWLESIDVNKLQDDTDYGSFMTGEDWKNIIRAAKNDPEICKLKITDSNRDWNDGGGGGFSALFTNPETKEAVVAFRGTASKEWKDDFVGGGKTDGGDGVSTKQQENALEWYQQTYEKNNLSDFHITVTGHSKGGNKSKYIAIMDDSVDRCVSFDGQGFSDEFIDQYQDKIAQRQDIIENHNVDYDYVNLLLNDVGNTTFYNGYDYGKGGFLENHCPNTFFSLNEDGTFFMTVASDGRPTEMEELDKFLNSYLRSLDGDDKARALNLIGTLVEGGFSKESPDELLNYLLADPEYAKDVAYLLAYVIEYEQANQDFINSIKGILKEFGMEDLVKYADYVDKILNSKYFDDIYGLINKIVQWGSQSEYLMDMLLQLLEDKCGIKLTKEELLALLGILGYVKEYMDDIQIHANSGEDKKIESVRTSETNGKLVSFYVDTTKMENVISEMQDIVSALRDCENRVNNVKAQLDIVMMDRGIEMINMAYYAERISEQKEKCENMLEILSEILVTYDQAETVICSTTT